MKKPFSLPFRQIHLDFHTGPWIPDVGRDFDAREFARRMKAAHVSSVTVFAKCHHGHLYYQTRRPERHPGLKPGLDLLRAQVEALHREGIRAPIYISVQCDEYAANTHPEWVARKPDTGQVKWGASVFTPGWQILDLSSPYQEFLAEQTAEVLRLFRPVDGIFFDMCWDQPSTTQWAVAGMRKARLNPEDERDRGRYARQVALAYMQRFHRMTKAASPGATVFFNARPFFTLREDIRFQEQVEIEALPTGGWGYIYFPKNVRYARTFGKPYMGMTGRFHKSWADFGGLKPYPALEYETSQMIAHGARCSIGDQLHPRGVLDRAAYELIGKVYARVEAREPWLEGARPVTQIGVFQLPTGILGTTQTTSGTDEGAVRMLTQLRHQFDVLDEASALDGYELLVLPDAIPLNAALVKRLRHFIRRGGALLASGVSGLSPDARRVVLPELPIRPHGLSPFTATYVRFGPAIGADVPPSDHVMYERGVRVKPAAGAGAEVLAGVVEPYFERTWDHFCSHKQTPGDRLSPWAAAVLGGAAGVPARGVSSGGRDARRSRGGKGRVGYISYPIFSAFAKHGNYPYRLLVRNILDLLLPEPFVRVDGPTGLEVSLTRQRGRSIVHLLYYAPERRATNLDLIEDIVPLRDLNLSVKLARRPARAYLAPEKAPLDFHYQGGRARVTVPELRGHAMVVFE